MKRPVDLEDAGPVPEPRGTAPGPSRQPVARDPDHLAWRDVEEDRAYGWQGRHRIDSVSGDHLAAEIAQLGEEGIRHGG